MHPADVWRDFVFDTINLAYNPVRSRPEIRSAAVDVEGGLDPGYPLPGKDRQARLPPPKGSKLEGLTLKAELAVKSV